MSPSPSRSGSAPDPSTELDPARLVTTADYDWADRRQGEALRALQHATAERIDAAVAHPPRPRLDKVIVVRESDAYNRVLLDGGLRQACARNRDAPDLALVEAAGLDPLYAPERCTFEVVQTRGEAFRAAFFILGGVGWVLSPASAKTTTSRGDNAFTSWMITLVTEYQPRILDAFAFGRLVRDLDHGPLLGQACARCVDVVWAGSNQLDFVNHRAASVLTWQVLTIAAASERDEIVRRHTAGVLTKYLKGQWVLKDTVAPLGYRYDEAHRTLVRDDARRQDVEYLLRVLIADLPDSIKVQRLAGRGLLPRHPMPTGVSSKLRSLLRWTPLYLTGVWYQHWTNPMAELTEWMGLPILGRTDTDRGYFLLKYDLGLPPGGWAPPAVLHGALDRWRAIQLKEETGQRRGGQLPLLGYRETGPCGPGGDLLEWRLCGAPAGYVLRARPPVPADREAGR